MLLRCIASAKKLHQVPPAWAEGQAVAESQQLAQTAACRARQGQGSGCAGLCRRRAAAVPAPAHLSSAPDVHCRGGDRSLTIQGRGQKAALPWPRPSGSPCASQRICPAHWLQQQLPSLWCVPIGLTRPPDAPATPQATKLGGKCPAYYKCPKGSTQPTSSNNACPGYKLAAAGGRALCVCFRVFAELTGCNSDHTAHRVRPKARHIDVVRVLLDDVKELLHLQRTAGETHQMLAACCAAPSGREKLWPELGLMSGNFHLGLHKTASPACGTEARKGCTQMKGTCTPGMQFCGWALEVFAIALAAHDAVTASALGSCRCTLGRSLPCMCETGCMSAELGEGARAAHVNPSQSNRRLVFSPFSHEQQAGSDFFCCALPALLGA